MKSVWFPPRYQRTASHNKTEAMAAGSRPFCVIVLTIVVILLENVHGDSIANVDTSHYHNYTTLQKLFRRLSDENPTLARLYTIGKSVQGRQLYVLRISSDLDKFPEKTLNPGDDDDLRFALNGKPMFKYGR